MNKRPRSLPWPALLLAALLLALSGAATGPAQAANFALVIEAGAPGDPWPALPGADGVAANVAAILGQHGYRVEVETGPDAARLRTALKDFIARHGRSEDNRLLFYFIGHGHAPDSTAGPRISSFVPVAAPNPAADPEGFRRTALGLDEVEALAASIPAGQALFLFDACLSAPGLSTDRPRPQPLGPGSLESARQIITAGSFREGGGADITLSEQFVLGLMGKADVNGDRAITAAEMALFLQIAVPLFSDNRLHPLYGRLDQGGEAQGDFVLMAADEPERAPAPEPDLASLPEQGREAGTGGDEPNLAEVLAYAPEPAMAPPAPIDDLKPPPETPGEPVEISRYPALDAPDRVKAEVEFAVQVALTEELLSPGTTIVQTAPDLARADEAGRLGLSLPEAESWPLDVILVAPGFDFVGSNIGAIHLPREGDSTPARFTLRARAAAAGEERRIYATLWHRGAFLAKISRPLTVLAEEDKTVEEAAPEEAPRPSLLGWIKRDDDQAPTTMDLNAVPADLTVFVLERRDPGRPESVQVIVNSPYLQPSTETYSLSGDLGDWLDRQYRRIAAAGGRGTVLSIPSEAGDRKQIQPLMDGLGRELYRKFTPPIFKQAFWELVRLRGERFQSIQIFTNSPRLPWELVKPSRADGSGERDFLGLSHKIARWHVSENFLQLDRPPQRLRVDQITCIAPRYDEAHALPGQEIELGGLRGLRGYRAVAGQYEAIKNLFAAQPEGIIHFSGHGMVEQDLSGQANYAILLEESVLDLEVWKGLLPSGRRKHPFYFFNACDVGQAHQVAGMVNGWAPAVLEAGAGGYVGALWPVRDLEAADFSVRFYQLLARGGAMEVAAMLREVRRQYHATGDPTYLAYVLYGDPHLTFVRQ